MIESSLPNRIQSSSKIKQRPDGEILVKEKQVLKEKYLVNWHSED